MKITLLIFIFLQYALAAPLLEMSKRSDPLKPSEDPFYKGPDGYEDQPLGSILRIRKMDNDYGFVVKPMHLDSIYQILVRSEDSFHQPIAVMSTLFVPYNADPSKLISYQVAQDASCFDCAPSYAMQIGSSPVGWITSQLEEILFLRGLVEGYYVLVPDHEGPKATYVAGWLAAYAVLNSIKGSLSSGNETGINEDADVVLWGYSGGAFATSWGASVQPTYYPELSLLGSSMGGIPVNISHVATYDMGTLYAGLVVMAINGLKNEYPDLKELMQEKMGDKYDTFVKADNFCLAQSIVYYAFDNFTDYLDEGAEIMHNPIVLNITDSNNLLTNGLTPTCPLFIYSSANDEIIPVSDTDDLVEMYCAAGLSVEYRKDTVSDHAATAVSRAGAAFKFLKDRFDGVKVNPSCQTSTQLTNLLLEGSFSGLGDIGGDLIAALEGYEIGPGVTPQNISVVSTVVATGEDLFSSFFGGSSNSLDELISSITSIGSRFLSDFFSAFDSNSTSLAGFLPTLASIGSSLFGGSENNSSTTSSSQGILSSLLLAGTSLFQDLGSSSNSTGSSLGLLSTIISTGSSLLGDFGSGSNSTSSSLGLLSTVLSAGLSLVSSLLN